MKNIVEKYRKIILTHDYFQFLFVQFERFYLPKQTPIIVYQMGKVGSTAVHNSLRLQGFKSYQTHILGKRSGKKQQSIGQMPLSQQLKHRFDRQRRRWVSAGLLNQVINKHSSIKVITLVREPISRNISGFFENPWRFIGNEDIQHLSQKTLTDIFLEKFYHQRPLVWFDSQFKSVLDIDIYQHRFPFEQGYLTVKQGKFEFLILKLELADTLKEQAIANFLNVPSFTLYKANEGTHKPYGNVYQSFKKNLELPNSYIDAMCNAKYTRHFYSPTEIAQMRATWQKVP